MEHSLEELAESNSVIILDTCAFFYLDGFRRCKNNPSQSDIIKRNSARKFYQLAERTRRIYITSKICDEITLKKAFLNTLNRDYKKHQRDKTIRRLKVIKKERQATTKFIEYLRSIGRILNYSDLEHYKTIDKNSRSIKDYCKLSNTDWDFLITGIIASLTDDPICLISNDFQIGNAWDMCLECNLFKEDNLTFYFRKKFDTYKRFDHPK